MKGSFEKVDSKWGVPIVFLTLILIGIFLTTGKTQRDEQPESVSAPPTTATVEALETLPLATPVAAEVVAVDPWTVVHSEPATVEEPKIEPENEPSLGSFPPLFPMTESAQAEAEPVIARNGNTTPELPESVSDPEETVEGVSSNWVSFICVYQPSHGRNRSDWVYYFFPMSTESPACPTAPQTQPMTYYTVPVVYPVYWPVYYSMPAVLPPVYPAWPMPMAYPRVVPSWLGKTPKWVYPNGMVVKPKVYFRGRPVRNVLRAVIP